MKNYKITIQYDGTKYNGWQRQGNTQNTLAEKFENVLSRMCANTVEICASGRNHSPCTRAEAGKSFLLK